MAEPQDKDGVTKTGPGFNRMPGAAPAEKLGTSAAKAPAQPSSASRIPTGTPAEIAAANPQKKPDESVREMQALLRITGYSNGPVNGISDKTTNDGKTKFLASRPEMTGEQTTEAILVQLRAEVSTSPSSLATMEKLKTEGVDGITAVQYGMRAMGSPVPITGMMNRQTVNGFQGLQERQAEMASGVVSPKTNHPDYDEGIQEVQELLRAHGITEVTLGKDEKPKPMLVDGLNGPITSAGLVTYKEKHGIDNGEPFENILKHMRDNKPGTRPGAPTVQPDPSVASTTQNQPAGSTASPAPLVSTQTNNPQMGLMQMLFLAIAQMLGINLSALQTAQATPPQNRPAVGSPTPGAQSPVAAPSTAVQPVGLTADRAEADRAHAAFLASLTPEQKKAFEDKSIMQEDNFYNGLTDEQKDLSRQADKAAIVVRQKEGLIKDTAKNLDPAQARQFATLVESMTPQQLAAFKSASTSVAHTGYPEPGYNPSRDGPWGAKQETIIKTPAEQARNWETFKNGLSPQQQQMLTSIEDKVKPSRIANVAPATSSPRPFPAVAGGTPPAPAPVATPSPAAVTVGGGKLEINREHRESLGMTRREYQQLSQQQQQWQDQVNSGEGYSRSSPFMQAQFKDRANQQRFNLDDNAWAALKKDQLQWKTDKEEGRSFAKTDPFTIAEMRAQSLASAPAGRSYMEGRGGMATTVRPGGYDRQTAYQGPSSYGSVRYEFNNRSNGLDDITRTIAARNEVRMQGRPEQAIGLVAEGRVRELLRGGVDIQTAQTRVDFETAQANEREMRNPGLVAAPRTQTTRMQQQQGQQLGRDVAGIVTNAMNGKDAQALGGVAKVLVDGMIRGFPWSPGGQERTYSQQRPQASMTFSLDQSGLLGKPFQQAVEGEGVTIRPNTALQAEARQPAATIDVAATTERQNRSTFSPG